MKYGTKSKYRGQDDECNTSHWLAALLEPPGEDTQLAIGNRGLEFKREIGARDNRLGIYWSTRDDGMEYYGCPVIMSKMRRPKGSRAW